MVKKKYDWKKTAWKITKQIIYVAIAGVASVYANNPYYLSVAPILNGIENYLKHKN